MVQWLSCWIHNPVFPGSNPGDGKVDSAFHPSDGVAVLMLRKCVGVVRIVRDPLGELLRQEFECTQPGLVCAAE